MIDVRELRDLAADMIDNSRRVVDGVIREANRAGRVVQREMRAEVRGGYGYLTSFPNSITYDVHPRLRGDVVVEVGPDKDKRQGDLGNLVYFGSRNNAPVAVLDGPLLRELPRVESNLAKLAAGVTASRL